MATYNFDFSVELSKEQAIELFAQTGNDSRLSPVDLKWLGIDDNFEKWDTDELVKVTKVLVAYLNANSTPFPYWLSEWDEICVVDTYTFYDQIDCFKEAGLKVSYAQWNKLENCLEGSELDGMSAFVADGSKKVLYLSNKSRFEEVKPIEWLQVNHLAKLGNSLNTEGFVNFLAMFANFKAVSETVVDLPTASSIMSTYSEARFNFETGEIKAGRDFAVRSKAFVNGCGLLSNQTLMMLLALQLAGMSDWGVGQTVVDGTIAFLTQLWEEEDLYGQVMDSNQQLRTIRENTCSLLKVVPNYQFPYFRLENNNSKDGVAEAVNYCIENKVPFMTDKNAMKRLVTGAGVTALAAAMLFDEEDGIAKLSTILDIAKPGKVLNRGWNMVAIAAEQGIDFQENFRTYAQAGLVFEHDSETHIIVKGDKRLTLTHDGRIITNGSGVGLTKKGFAYSARKTLRATFNAISIKEGETLDSIKADMELKLSEILASDRIIKASDSTEDKVIFKYRGKELIKYRGLNQDIILSSKYGCSYEVRKLATSKSLAISVTVVYFADDFEIKGRGIAIKAVLKRGHNVYILTEDGQEIEWEVALNSECLKGTASRLHQYAEYLLEQTGKQSFINFSTNILRTPAMDGSYYEQDLNDETCDFYTWWKENTKQYLIRDFVDYETYFKPIILGHVGLADSDCSNDKVYEALSKDENKDIRLVNPITKKYTLDIEEALDPSGKLIFVEEVVRGVLAPYTFQVEMATVRECTVPAQSPTLQQLCATYAAKPELGYKLLKNAQVTENAILGCAAMALNDPSLRGLDNSDDLSKEGASWENADSYTLTAKEIATVLNVSQFGMGYANIYNANEDPFLAFSEPGVEKKFKAKGLVNKVGIVKQIPGTKFTVKEVIDGTSWNYQVNVGTGYNVASVLTCEAALARYALIKASKAKDKAAVQQALSRLKLIAKTQGVGWITGYEDSWLCGFNYNGTELANELHEFRKLFTPEFKSFAGDITPGKTFTDIIKALTDRLEAISGIKFEQAVVAQFLWAYRIARGISALEKYSNTEDVQKAFSLSPEDMQMVAIAGAMRRCDQGRFANFLTANEEDEDSTGISVWTYLNSMWDKVQHQIPFFLRRKLYKSMIVQTEFADLTRSINNASEIGGKTNKNPRVLVKNDLMTGSSKVTVLLPEGEVQVPLVPLEFGSIDEKMDNPYGLEIDGEFYSFGELHGAFEYLHRYCPLNEEGKKDLTKTPDKVVKLKGSDQVLNFWVDTLSSKEIFQRAAERYPDGVVIYSADGIQEGDESAASDLEVYFNFADLLESAAFMGGGQATGIALSIAELLIGISSPYANRPSGWSTRARNLLSGIQGQMREMMKAGLLRRVGRVKPFAQGSKVMTSHSVPNVEIVEEGVNYSIPVFLVNPHDDLVKVGNYKAGDYCALFRTPQIAKCYGVLLFDETVSIGHIECNAFLNAKTHRGDGK